jgi:hypothetical protein
MLRNKFVSMQWIQRIIIVHRAAAAGRRRRPRNLVEIDASCMLLILRRSHAPCAATMRVLCANRSKTIR